jgi:hypothetical protein
VGGVCDRVQLTRRWRMLALTKTGVEFGRAEDFGHPGSAIVLGGRPPRHFRRLRDSARGNGTKRKRANDRPFQREGPSLHGAASRPHDRRPDGGLVIPIRERSNCWFSVRIRRQRFCQWLRSCGTALLQGQHRDDQERGERGQLFRPDRRIAHARRAMRVRGSKLRTALD